MWIDLLGLGLVLLFAGFGLWRGALESGLRLLAFFGCYGLAVLAAARSGGQVATALGIAPWVAAPIVGCLAFAAGWLLFAIAGVVVRRIERRRLAERPRPGWDRALGAGFGAARGGLLALLVGWLALFAGAVERAGIAAPLPDPSGAALPALTSRVVEQGARAVLGDEEPGARLTARMAARPAETFAELQRVLEHPDVTALQRDGAFWDALASGRVDSAMRRVSVLRISQDAALRDGLVELGVLDEAARQDPSAFRRSLGAALSSVAPRVQALRNDPELHRLAEDPEVERMLRSGETLALLAHPGFQRLVERVLAGPGADG